MNGEGMGKGQRSGFVQEERRARKVDRVHVNENGTELPQGREVGRE